MALSSTSLTVIRSISMACDVATLKRVADHYSVVGARLVGAA
jgi:hypothetical protein